MNRGAFDYWHGGILARSSVEPEQYAEDQVQVAWDAWQAGFMNGYDSGFIVGAEKGRNISALVAALKKAHSILEDEYPITDCRNPKVWGLTALLEELK